MQATPWSLDEFEMPDIFAPINRLALPGVARAGGVGADTDSDSLQELAHIEAAAYARGRADAERQARADANAQVTSAIAALNEALDSVRVHQARWVSNSEENLGVLAVAIAGHLLSRAVDTDAQIVASLVQRALTQFPLDQPITVRMHPDDIAACTGLIEPDASGRKHEIRWAPDTHVLRGGCMVEGRERIVDGRVDTALERVYRAIGAVQA